MSCHTSDVVHCGTQVLVPVADGTADFLDSVLAHCQRLLEVRSSPSFSDNQSQTHCHSQEQEASAMSIPCIQCRTNWGKSFTAAHRFMHSASLDMRMAGSGPV